VKENQFRFLFIFDCLAENKGNPSSVSLKTEALLRCLKAKKKINKMVLGKESRFLFTLQSHHPRLTLVA